MIALAIAIPLLLALLGAGLLIGLALAATGGVSLALFTDVPVLRLAAFDLWQSLNSAELAALPLFVLMGEILFHARLSDDLFRGLSPFLKRIPGRLLHTNVLGCALFAAVSGSSAATTATVGRITLKELAARGYDPMLTMGSLAGAGTLGFLIPPSIILILYGVLAEVSILDLFLAGIIPGLLLAATYMAYIAIRARNSPPAEDGEGDAPTPDRLAALGLLLPIVVLIILVLGSLYAGIASPSEAAVMGVAGAVVVGMVRRGGKIAWLGGALMGAVRTISMIGLILVGAMFFARAMAFIGVPGEMAAAIAALDLSPFALILMLLALYAVLGMVLDGFSAIVMTLPIVLPLIGAAGFDLVWFGIFLVIVVEMAQITPPVGFNLFVVQGLTGAPMARIARAAFPFFLIMLAFAVLLALAPDIALWLPERL